MSQIKGSSHRCISEARPGQQATQQLFSASLELFSICFTRSPCKDVGGRPLSCRGRPKQSFSKAREGFRINSSFTQDFASKNHIEAMNNSSENKFARKPLAWKRIVVKLSGEALMGRLSHGLDHDVLTSIAADLKDVAARGVEVAVVVGGGNFFRGIEGADRGIERARADSIGMLATVMNALALEYAIEKQGQAARTMSALPMPALCEAYSHQAALHHLAKGRTVVLGGGTGNPFFTTDTGAALRGAELSCDLIMKATKVDGVYSADPKRDPRAIRYDQLTHDEAISRNLAVMDTAAFALARENGIPIIVFSIREKGAILSALEGRGNATLVLP
jgi:uridylate kinase